MTKEILLFINTWTSIHYRSSTRHFPTSHLPNGRPGTTNRILQTEHNSLRQKIIFIIMQKKVTQSKNAYGKQKSHEKIENPPCRQ